MPIVLAERMVMSGYACKKAFTLVVYDGECDIFVWPERDGLCRIRANAQRNVDGATAKFVVNIDEDAVSGYVADTLATVQSFGVCGSCIWDGLWC